MPASRCQCANQPLLKKDEKTGNLIKFRCPAPCQPSISLLQVQELERIVDQWIKRQNVVDLAEAEWRNTTNWSSVMRRQQSKPITAGWLTGHLCGTAVGPHAVREVLNVSLRS